MFHYYVLEFMYQPVREDNEFCKIWVYFFEGIINLIY